MSKYLIFEEVPNPGRKTKKIRVLSKAHSAFLGVVQWYASWRQYVVLPADNTVWSVECLDDLKRKIAEIK